MLLWAMDVRLLDITDQGSDSRKWHDLLEANGLRPESLVDRVFGLFENDRLIATAARFTNTLKLIAVAPEYRGGAVFNQVVEAVLKDAFLSGYHKLFVYTTPEAAHAFAALGFTSLISAEVIFMERGAPTLSDYLSFLRSKKIASEKAGAIVMHANPFTKGHLFLVETALTQSDIVYVFVLSEDMSPFSPADRLRLVQEGIDTFVEAKGRVIVLPTNDYLVSTQTFPSYFLPDNDQVISAQAAVDAALFKTYIAPALDIKQRFVGEEPLSHTTDLYNAELTRVFAGQPTLSIIPRLEIDGAPVSASRVRKLFDEGKLDRLRRLVPEPTYRYLKERSQSSGKT